MTNRTWIKLLMTAVVLTLGLWLSLTPRPAEAAACCEYCDQKELACDVDTTLAPLFRGRPVLHPAVGQLLP